MTASMTDRTAIAAVARSTGPNCMMLSCGRRAGWKGAPERHAPLIAPRFAERHGAAPAGFDARFLRSERLEL